jgi:hypothetical protein
MIEDVEGKGGSYVIDPVSGQKKLVEGTDQIADIIEQPLDAESKDA